ncbi:MAG TPA: hypothetical protein VEX62_12775, partial [Candidatus Limnocylindrales bacterium]|nr:hypothetical protein [Candidatus Limnocylindrales bacterium]
TSVIRELDAETPITIGLHLPSLEADNGLRVDRAFETCDYSVMHAYSVYADWADGPTDTELVPFVCALTAALSGKRVLAEEFGAPTAPPGEPTQQLAWKVDGVSRQRTLLAEDELARHLETVLPRLVEIGAAGALVWCFADYEEPLWNRPPLDRARHERFFGLVRPDGSLKPHAEVLKRFAATSPLVAEAPALPDLSISGADYYSSPRDNLLRLYREFRELRA